MSADSKPLFVRLASEDADRLDAAVAATGKNKRRLVSEALREQLTVGRISLVEEGRTPFGPDSAAPPNEVMTLAEAAAFLRLKEAQLERSAAKSELPARCIAGQWRFSRIALLAWLDSAASRPGEDS